MESAPHRNQLLFKWLQSDTDQKLSNYEKLYNPEASLRTGDALLFSSNTPTAFLLRTFVSSDWNHSGIAVRVCWDKTDVNKTDVNKTDVPRISLTEEGDLYIFETNTGTRPDDVLGGKGVGAGFSRAAWVFAKYNRIAVRRLQPILRTEILAQMTLAFARMVQGTKFPGSSLPFLGVWLGIPLAHPVSDEMFCSELMVHYYAYVLYSKYKTHIGGPAPLNAEETLQRLINPLPFNQHLNSGLIKLLFGHNSPSSPEMFTPGHYTASLTPNAAIFVGVEETLVTKGADLIYVILQPLLIILCVAIVIWMTLPDNQI